MLMLLSTLIQRGIPYTRSPRDFSKRCRLLSPAAWTETDHQVSYSPNPHMWVGLISAFRKNQGIIGVSPMTAFGTDACGRSIAVYFLIFLLVRFVYGIGTRLACVKLAH